MQDLIEARQLYLNRVHSPSRIRMLLHTAKLGYAKTDVRTLTRDQYLELGFRLENHVWLFPRWLGRVMPRGEYTTVHGNIAADSAQESKGLFGDLNLSYGVPNLLSVPRKPTWFERLAKTFGQ